MFVAASAFPKPYPHLIVTVLLSVPVQVIVWFALANFFELQARESSEIKSS
jgi:hypothetical protein